MNEDPQTRMIRDMAASVRMSIEQLPQEHRDVIDASSKLLRDVLSQKLHPDPVQNEIIRDMRVFAVFLVGCEEFEKLMTEDASA